MLFSKISFYLFLQFFIGGVEVVVAYIATTGVFTGINAATGERPLRRDITELRNDVPAFSLYIQALAAMQDAPETDQKSWFQISGIHGRPYYAWDFVARTPGAPAVGYCTHGDVLFMTWHRPYLALYEQILANHVQAIAKRYNSPTYQRAADRFRIPYWDWAVPPYRMPDFFNSATIRITKPTGPVDVPNPLASYRFRRQPYPSTTFPSTDRLAKFPRTVRRPRGGVSDPGAINTLLAAQGPGIAQQLYTVFSRATAYNNMATQTSSGPSFEGPHGWLHITVGGDGHMTDVGYAGFDPIFLLHHTNVDRLGVMWQAIYPNSFLQPAREGGGSWTLVPGQTLNAATPLLPFHAKDGRTPWTSNSARYAKSFGYAYPDVKDWTFTGTNAAARLAASVTARVNQLYNVRARSAKRSIRGATLEDRAAVSREWTVAVSAPNAALAGTSYTVLLFLGPKPADPMLWIVESVGAMYVLAQPMSPGSGPMIAHTEVVLTEFMQDAGVDPTDVVASKAFLDKNLTWGVQKADGTVVPNDKFQGLELLVEEDVVKLPTDDTQLPKYSDKTIHPDITETIKV